MINDQVEEEEAPSQESNVASKMINNQHNEDRKIVEREYHRMGFDADSRWRISDINKDFELCNTYPRFLIVPSTITDEDLESVAKFRYFRRIPTAVWRHNKNGCFIVRSSQPTVGWFGWFRSELDENLVQTYVNNTIQQKQLLQHSSREEHKSASDSEHANDNNDHSGDQVDGQRACMDVNIKCRLIGNGGADGYQLDVNSASDCTHLNGNNGHMVNGRDQKDQTLRNSRVELNSNVESTTCGRLIDINSTVTGNNNDPDLSDKVSKVTAIVDGTTARTTESNSNTASNQTASNDVKSLSDALAKCVELSETPNSHIPTSTSNNNDPKNPVQTLASNLINSSDIPPTSTSTNNVTTTTTTTPSTTPTSSNTASTPTSTPTSQAPTNTSKMLIIDARSYAAAMANRAKGGGCECSEYYQRCEVHFMNLANIHSIRKSYHAIRSVCEAYSEQSNNWVSFLDNSRWLHHISGLLKSALLVVDAIDFQEKSILIHCSDGWDRTPQLVALAEIMLDPHYRTFEGFKTLIQREWLDFGHKFADRCGSNPCNEDPNERCPVFLQWLDCVQQLLVQYPKHFEFNSNYLDKLNRHTYSNTFGTFSYNSNQERILSRVEERMGSLWSYFDSSQDKYKNDSYVKSDEILRPSFKVKDLHFWKEVYLPPVNQPKTNLQTPFVPITTPTTTTTTTTINNTTTTTPTTNNLDSNKCSHDSLYMDGLTRTVCK